MTTSQNIAAKLPTTSFFSKGKHIVAKALAGTGKTTTGIEGLHELRGGKSQFTPSDEQRAIWDALKVGPTPKSIHSVAFNKSIATVLQDKVPAGVTASTMHSMGLQSLKAAFTLRGRKSVNAWRTKNHVEELTGKDIRELFKDTPDFVTACDKLVGLCKLNLSEGTETELDEISAHYDVDMNGSKDKVYDLVPRLLARAKDINKDGYIDFNDMVAMPSILQLPVRRHDLLIVDEAQDLNRAQQQLAIAASDRLMFVGDENQAIYGFAGADSESMQRMVDHLDSTDRGCVTLPLTETRRCAKAIVAEAQKIVPSFRAHESNPEGLVGQAGFDRDKRGYYGELAQSGDLCVCRVNAPLVHECFGFLKEGRKANIQGRDIGQGLITTIKKLKASNISDLSMKINDWYHEQCQKENAKKNPRETRLIAIQDRYECLEHFCDAHSTIDSMVAHIQELFTEQTPGDSILLSSIHRAKGLEANRVFFLEPEGASCPHPMASSDWQVKQEWNLRYVAITRAINELYYVA